VVNQAHEVSQARKDQKVTEANLALKVQLVFKVQLALKVQLAQKVFAALKESQGTFQWQLLMQRKKLVKLFTKNSLNLNWNLWICFSSEVC
jgi:hypothetical protein